MVNRCSWQRLSFWQDFEILSILDHSHFIQASNPNAFYRKCYYLKFLRSQELKVTLAVGDSRLKINLTVNAGLVDFIPQKLCFALLESLFVASFPMNADYIKLAIIQIKYATMCRKNLFKKYVMQIEF